MVLRRNLKKISKIVCQCEKLHRLRRLKYEIWNCVFAYTTAMISAQVDDANPPWCFFTSYDHDPMLYGYRGLIVEWDYTASVDCAGSSDGAATAFRLNGEDEASFPDEVDVRPDDFHRLYCPYRRLVGVGVFDRFNRVSTSSEANVELRASSSLAEFVRRLQGYWYARDQIQPVYRPVATPQPPPAHADDHQRAGSHDGWYAMVECSDRPEQAAAASQLTTTTTVVTSSTAKSDPLPVVVEVSAEDRLNGNGTEVPASETNRGNGHMTGNGIIDRCVVETETEGDVDVVLAKKPTSTLVVTHATIVRHVNGNAVEANDAVDGGPVNGNSELPDDDVVKTPNAGFIIEEANRRTIRSDL